MSSHRRNQTHRQIPREIEAGVPENRSQKKQSAPQKPTDPWVFGYGKPPWETAAETLWETEVWCLLCPGMDHTVSITVAGGSSASHCRGNRTEGLPRAKGALLQAGQGPATVAVEDAVEQAPRGEVDVA